MLSLFNSHYLPACCAKRKYPILNFINFTDPRCQETRMIMKLIAIIILCVALNQGSALAGDSECLPKDQGTISASTDKKTSVNPAAWIVSFYRKHISRVDGDRCPSYPSCATYSLKALKKHGLVMGWLMTVDRLIHEGSEELKVSPMIFHNGKMKIYDPVENNDFWWYHPDEEKSHN